MKNVLNIVMAFAVVLIGLVSVNPVKAGQYLYEAGSTGATITVSTCTGCRVVNVKNIPNVIADDGISDAGAFNTYVQSNKTDIVYFFPRGVYNWGGQTSMEALNRVAFVGEKGAIIRKNGVANSGLVLDGSGNDVNSGYSGEWIWHIFRSTNVTVAGLRFEGLTTSTTDYDFGEQGIYCGSCNRWLVEDNEFWNFGDAATRSSTYAGDTNGTVQSFNTRIRNNYYNNIFQVSTTPNDTPVNGVARGGTENMIVEDNIFDNLKGSVKICARHETHHAKVTGNMIKNSSAISTSAGVEMCSVSDIVVAHNIITGSGLWGITYYTNDGFGLNGWDWDNINITSNIIHDAFRGIRMSNGNYAGDSYHSNSGGIVITNNSLLNITGPNSAITFQNTFGSGFVSGNVCKNITSGTCVTTVSGITAGTNPGS